MSEINYLQHNAELLLEGVPKSVKKVFKIIKKAGKPLRVTEISRLAEVTPRTIRLALSRLYTLNLVVKVADLTDLRSHFLQINPQLVTA